MVASEGCDVGIEICSSAHHGEKVKHSINFDMNIRSLEPQGFTRVVLDARVSLFEQ